MHENFATRPACAYVFKFTYCETVPKLDKSITAHEPEKHSTATEQNQVIH